jgi:protein arginine kinase activator
MLCEDCHEREANVHLTQVVNDKKSVLNLCLECADKRGFSNPLKNVPFPLGDFLSSMVDSPRSDRTGQIQQITCLGCGLTFGEFSKYGRLGCGKCYEAFRTQLEQLLRKIHGSSRHCGKLPAGSPEKMVPLIEERKLQEELRRAVEEEKFELAAELRDRLKTVGIERH